MNAISDFERVATAFRRGLIDESTFEKSMQELCIDVKSELKSEHISCGNMGRYMYPYCKNDDDRTLVNAIIRVVMNAPFNTLSETDGVVRFYQYLATGTLKLAKI